MSTEGFAFCPHCGNPLQPAATAEVRKTVTVLFCDVTGSTAIGERLDPESLRKLMGQYFDAARSCVERHGGTVEKFIGDAVMAVFGIPQVHEDDALRACRAAAEIRQQVAALSKELQRDYGTTFDVRIGVNTGEVVAGDPIAGQALVTGDAVNVAARLEQEAPPGGILIGGATYRLVRDAVVAEPTEALALKGKTEPVPAFRLRNVHPTAPAFARRLDSPMIGREEELRLLRRAFDRAVAERSCQLATVLGAAGAGKSRLIEELIAGLPGARILRGRCLPYGEGITFYPVLEVLKQAAEIADFEESDLAERKLRDVVQGDEQASLICARLGHLLGISEAEAVPEETLWAIRRFLEALALTRPLVVVFDDIHWGEATFLDLVEHVASWTRDAPILLVCMARPELLDLRPDWASGAVTGTTVRLQPLPDDQAVRLVENLLGGAGIAEGARARILDSAEGNPLFVEQVVSMLVDDGLLVRKDGMWTAASDLSDVPVPPTMAALMAARLDRLSGGERAVIQRASVVGKTFYRGAVAALSPEVERPEIGRHLLSLVRKELVAPDLSSLPGEDAVTFRHLLIRDAAYERIAKELRAELHERFAAWLEEVAGDRIEEQGEVVGYHLEQACRYLAEVRPADERRMHLARRAAEHFSAAGRRASARGDMGATASLLGRAVDLLPRGDLERLPLLPDLGMTLVEAGHYEEASRILDEAIEEAVTAGDRVIEANARVAAVVRRIYSDPEGTGEEATRVADEVIPILEEAGDDLGLARAYRLRSTAPWLSTRYAEMAADAERAAEHARRAGDPGEQVLDHDMVAVAYTFGPFPVDEALRKLDALQEQYPGRRRELDAGAAVLLGMAGRFGEARQILEQASALFEDLGRPAWVAATDFGRGVVEFLADDLEQAERFLRQGREGFLRLGEKGVLSSLSALLAMAVCLQGRFQEAEPFIEESRELASSEDVASQASWRMAKAKVLAARRDLGEAERVAREALALVKSGDGLDDHGNASSVLAEVVLAAGRINEAEGLLEEAIDAYERKQNVVSAARARQRLAALRAG